MLIIQKTLKNARIREKDKLKREFYYVYIYRIVKAIFHIMFTYEYSTRRKNLVLKKKCTNYGKLLTFVNVKIKAT